MLHNYEVSINILSYFLNMGRLKSITAMLSLLKNLNEKKKKNLNHKVHSMNPIVFLPP